jgi:hypothetical protein
MRETGKKNGKKKEESKGEKEKTNFLPNGTGKIKIWIKTGKKK